jgi:hypothetical protein
MKLFYAFATVSAAALFAFLLVRPGAPAHSYSSGAPAAFSGPEQYCNACHGGVGNNPVNSGTGFVEITGPATFEPGEVVPITVSVYNTSIPDGPSVLQGFEVSARVGGSLDHVGDFEVDGTTVQYAQGDERYVTHTSASNADTSWTFAWVAPATDAPPTVLLYVAGNAANGNGFPDEGDEIYADSLELALVTANEPGASPLAFRLEAPYPNPLRTAATVRYVLDRPAPVEVALRDGRGRVVRVLERAARGAGAYTLRLSADGLAAGTYFLTLATPEGTQAQPVTVAR